MIARSYDKPVPSLRRTLWGQVKVKKSDSDSDLIGWNLVPRHVITAPGVFRATLQTSSPRDREIESKVMAYRGRNLIELHSIGETDNASYPASSRCNHSRLMLSLTAGKGAKSPGMSLACVSTFNRPDDV